AAAIAFTAAAGLAVLNTRRIFMRDLRGRRIGGRAWVDAGPADHNVRLIVRPWELSWRANASQDPDMQLEGKRIAITGAFGTLGAAVVQAALDAGAKVAALDLAATPAGADDRVHAFGGVDVCDAGAASKAMDA